MNRISQASNKSYVRFLKNALHKNINKATYLCKHNPQSKTCAAAWDQVEDLQKSLHIVQKRSKHKKTELNNMDSCIESLCDGQHGEIE